MSGPDPREYQPGPRSRPGGGPDEALARMWTELDPVALTQQNLVAQARLRATVTRSIVGLWGTLAPYNRPEAAKFVSYLLPLARGAQTAMSVVTASYLHQVISATANEPASTQVTVPPRSVVGAVLRDGLDQAELYQRPFTTVWWRLSKGDDPAVARQKGLDRALTIALTDLQLAKTHTARAVLTAMPEVSAYRRVTRGDLSCPLCTTQLGPFPAEQLLPIHDRCSCDLEPLLHASAPAPAPTEQHGELGPLLERST